MRRLSRSSRWLESAVLLRVSGAATGLPRAASRVSHDAAQSAKAIGVGIE